jgi:hypothetical protein
MVIANGKLPFSCNQDEFCAQIGELNKMGFSFYGLFGKSEQQAKRASISSDSPLAYRSVLLQMICE